MALLIRVTQLKWRHLDASGVVSKRDSQQNVKFCGIQSTQLQRLVQPTHFKYQRLPTS